MKVLYKSRGHASNGKLEVYDNTQGLELIMGWKTKPLTIPKERLRFSNGVISLLYETGEQVLRIYYAIISNNFMTNRGGFFY